MLKYFFPRYFFMRQTISPHPTTPNGFLCYLPESGCQVTSCSQGRFAASVGTWRWAEIRPWIRGCLNHRFRIPSRCCRSDDYYTKNLYHPSWTYISDTKWATTVWNFASRYCLLTQAEMLRSFVGNWVVTVIN